MDTEKENQPQRGTEEAPSSPEYPEECCDASEIADGEFERWRRGAENGFWKDFVDGIDLIK